MAVAEHKVEIHHRSEADRTQKCHLVYHDSRESTHLIFEARHHDSVASIKQPRDDRIDEQMLQVVKVDLVRGNAF